MWTTTTFGSYGDLVPQLASPLREIHVLVVEEETVVEAPKLDQDLTPRREACARYPIRRAGRLVRGRIRDIERPAGSWTESRQEHGRGQRDRHGSEPALGLVEMPLFVDDLRPDDADSRFTNKTVHEAEHSLGIHARVGIDEDDIRGVARPPPDVARKSEPIVVVASDRANGEVGNRLECLVGRVVVNHDHVDVGMTAERLDERTHVLAAVVGDDDDVYACHALTGSSSKCHEHYPRQRAGTRAWAGSWPVLAKRDPPGCSGR